MGRDSGMSALCATFNGEWDVRWSYAFAVTDCFSALPDPCMFVAKHSRLTINWLYTGTQSHCVQHIFELVLPLV